MSLKKVNTFGGEIILIYLVKLYLHLLSVHSTDKKKIQKFQHVFIFFQLMDELNEYKTIAEKACEVLTCHSRFLILL